MKWGDLNSFRPPKNLDFFAGNFQPNLELVFQAFKLTPFDEVKCVILGQDPYHTPGYANGLAFSVQPHVKKLPPSLRNILREYESDLGYPQPRNGDLTSWAREGVLLLNSILTVETGKPLSHRGLGWEKLTIEVLRALNREREHLSFILWGKEAQQYKGLIDPMWHNIITAPHPSPFSVNQGFFGHQPFSRANGYRAIMGFDPINWRLG